MSDMSKEAQRVQYLLSAVVKTRPEEINCDEAQELVDEYIELELSGSEIPAQLQQLKEHLEWCGCCKQVVQAIKDAISGLKHES